ncbi:MAG: hypothetical protein ABI655_14385 [Phenylobacterium sp.]
MQLLGIHWWRVALYVDCAYWLLVVGFALWRGRWRERTLAAAMLVSAVGLSADWWFSYWVAPFLGAYDGWRPGLPPAWFEPLTDVVILAVCLTCALRSDRYWPIWASSFALLTIVVHLVWPLTSGLTSWTHTWAMDIWFSLMATALLSGAWSTHRERVRAAARSQSPP